MAIKYLDARRIRGSSTGAATPTYSTTFGSTSGWSSNDTHVFIDTGNNMLEFELDDDGTDEFINYDMGAGNISNTEWVLRCELTFTTFNAQTNDNNNILLIGCYDNASPSGITASGDALSWGWYMRGTTSTDGHDTKLRSINGGSESETEGNNNPFSSSTATNTPFYIELKRVSADSLEFRCFSDSSYSTQVGSTIIRATSSSVTALRYLTINLFCQGTVQGGGYKGYIQNLKFYNAATTTTADEKATLVTAAPWTKEGTQTNVTGGLVEVRNVAQNTSGVSYPLGLTVDGDFVLRFKYKQNAASGGNGDVVGLTSGSIHHTSQEVIDLILFNGYFYLVAKTGGSVIQSSGGQSNGSDQDTDMNPVDGTQYYGELKRSGNVYTATVRTGSHSGSVFERVLTFTKTSGNHATPNRIFIGAQRDSQAKSIDVDDIEFWDDTNSTSGSATYTQNFSTDVVSATSDLPENTLFEETDTYKTHFLQSAIWKSKDWLDSSIAWDGQRGVIAGGNTASDEIKYITIASPSATTDFGNLTSGRGDCGGVSNGTRACFGGGSSGNIIDYITVSTTGNASDFGDLTQNNGGTASMGASGRGVFGMFETGSNTNISYISIDTVGNATDFGNATWTQNWKESCGTQDDTRGVMFGFYLGGSNIGIDYLTIATTGSSADFGDLSSSRMACSACSDGTYACCCGGATYINNSNYAETNIIDRITIQTTGTASDIGDLRQNQKQGFACNDKSTGRGVSGGGNTDEMDYFTLASFSGTATDFGNINNTDRKQKATSGT